MVGDYETGTVTIMGENGRPLLFDMEEVGSIVQTYEHDSVLNRWQWSWDDSNIPESAVVPREPLEEIGRKLDLPYLLHSDVAVTHDSVRISLLSIALNARGALGVCELSYTFDAAVYVLLRNPREVVEE